MGEMENIHKVCQSGLGWDDARWQSEVNAYRALWQRSYSPPEKK
jgi:glycerol-3-phosphate dehydrogenase